MMDCFFTAFRLSLSTKLSSRSGASDVDDAIWGVLRKAISGSSSNSSAFSAEEAPASGHATSRLKRQRAVAFFMGCYVCGMKGSVRDEEEVDGNSQYFIEVEVQKGAEEPSRKIKGLEKEAMQWRQERGKKRRKLGREEWVAGGEASDGNLLFRVPARLKRLMRRVRAKMRKMGQVKKTANFQYDPLSYSMNFDEGCWQHCEAHARPFYSSSLSVKSSCNSSGSTGKASMCAE